jgi:peptide-methionine (S)-S-oxide reductase
MPWVQWKRWVVRPRGGRRERSKREGGPCRRVLLGHARPDPEAAGHCLDEGRILRRRVPNATYRSHGTHAEAIEIVFDPEQVSYRDLLEFFFQIHDPTTLNRQGNDMGLSYRSAIFYEDEEQRRIAEETIAEVEASGRWPGKVVAEVSPAGPFWEAEPEHQDYLEKYPNGYTCHFVRPNWVVPTKAAAG